MRKLLLVVCCVSYLGSNAQEMKTPVYTDTVDIVDFLEDVYRNTGKFKTATDWAPNDSFYSLENVAISSKVEIMDDSLHEIIRQQMINKSENFDWETAYSQVSEECFSRLKKRLKIVGDTIRYNQKIKITNSHFIRPNGYHDRLSGLGMNTNGVVINNMIFSSFEMNRVSAYGYLTFEGCVFNAPNYDWWENSVHLEIMECVFKKRFILHSLNKIEIKNSIFKDGCELFVQADINIYESEFQTNSCDTLIHDKEDDKIYTRGGGNNFGFKFSNLDSIKQGYLLNINKIAASPLYIDTEDLEKYSNGHNEGPINILKITKSKFSINCKSGWISIKTHVKNLNISNCDIPLGLNFSSSKVDNSFTFLGNRNVQGVSIENLLFSELKNYIDWNSIRSYGLKIKDDQNGHREDHLYAYYDATNYNIISNELRYNKVIEMYKYLFDNYRKQGTTVSANGCYAELKQIETSRWKYLYQQDKSFESLFRWQLNVFLNYFTDYGTNPAKAVIKSGWVILLFAIFYLFFPSDWDVTNRSQLMARTKDLFNKNRERTILWTLGFVSWSAFVHILNALTLSLNAFTTLGFGEIPTHGAARYVTIIQGFIGWFLLTIFSVSLINQVLG